MQNKYTTTVSNDVSEWNVKGFQSFIIHLFKGKEDIGYLKLAILDSSNFPLDLKNYLAIWFGKKYKQDELAIYHAQMEKDYNFFADKPLVYDVYIKEEYRGQELSIYLYKEAFKFTSSLGLQLYSNTSLTRDANRIWTRLVEKNHAKSIETENRFKMISNL